MFTKLTHTSRSCSLAFFFALIFLLSFACLAELKKSITKPKKKPQIDEDEECLMLSSKEKYVLVQRVANLAIVMCSLNTVQKIVKAVICKRSKNYATIKSSVAMGSIWLAFNELFFFFLSFRSSHFPFPSGFLCDFSHFSKQFYRHFAIIKSALK